MSLLTWPTLVTFAIIIGALVLFVTEAMPIELVSLLIVFSLAITGILPVKKAISGFSNEAVLTVGALFVISSGLIQSGLIDRVTGFFVERIEGNFTTTIVIFLTLTALLSAFINNTAVVIMFIPIGIGIARRMDVSPSKLLIPISYAAIIGGTCSLIGTSTNLLADSLLRELVPESEPLGMFEFTRVGAVFLVVGIVYIVYVVIRWLPERKKAPKPTSHGRIQDFVSEVRILEGSSLIDRTIEESLHEEYPDIEIKQIVRGERIFWPPKGDFVFQPGDILIVKGRAKEVAEFQNEEKVELLPEVNRGMEQLRTQDVTLAEVAITPNSKLVGKSLNQIDFRTHYNAVPMAIQRHEKHIRKDKIYIPLQVGDVLLVQGEPSTIETLQDEEDFLQLRTFEAKELKPQKAALSLAITLGFILCASFSGTLNIPVSVAALGGAIATVLTGCLKPQKAYDEINWSVLILIAGAIPLGVALNETNGARILSNVLVSIAKPLGVFGAVAGVYLLTNVLTEIITNNAAAALVIPICVQMVDQIPDLSDPRPLIFAVCFAASACFSTPTGYQTNTLVYGPGGYHYTDYVRVGFGLNVLFWIIATVLIPVLWGVV